MQKLLIALLICFISTKSFGQTHHKTSMYLQGEYNKTLHDVTKGNNPWGMGLGLQLFLANTSKLKPTVELTADAYLEDDKVLRLNPDGTPMNDVGGMFNLFAGGSYHPTRTLYFSIMAGPSFVSGQTLLGVKPSLGFYFSPNQKWMGNISYINIFNRDKKEDFGSLSLSLGVKLF